VEALIDPFTKDLFKQEESIEVEPIIYLIVGGSGFLGVNFSMALTSMNKSWLNIDLNGGNTSKLYQNSFVDINDSFTLLKLKHDKRQKVLIHLAAPSTHLTNLEKLRNFTADEPLILNEDELFLFKKIEKILDIGVSSFVFASTIDVYGNTLLDDLPVNEKSVCAPNTGYAKTKFTLERLYGEAAKKRGIPIQILRIGHIYGPLEHLYYSRLLTTLSASISSIEKKKTNSKLVVELPLNFRRQYIYTFDIIRITLMLLRLESSLVVNIVGKSVDSGILGAAYKSICGFDLEIVSRVGPDDYSSPITSLLGNIKDFPRQSFAQGLACAAQSRLVAEQKGLVSRIN
jgi:nucleoside-diphosphate-sugar epimerase